MQELAPESGLSVFYVMYKELHLLENSLGEFAR